jgi:hypothetical protein
LSERGDDGLLQRAADKILLNAIMFPRAHLHGRSHFIERPRQVTELAFNIVQAGSRFQISFG